MKITHGKLAIFITFCVFLKFFFSKNVCKEPQNIGRCEHFCCLDCVSKIETNNCPSCNVPFVPNDRQPDRIVAGLVSTTNDLLNLFKGERLCCKK